MKPQSPCRECEKRVVGCHAGCEKYAGYCKELELWKQTVRAAKEEGSEADAFRHKTYQLIQRIGGNR